MNFRDTFSGYKADQVLCTLNFMSHAFVLLDQNSKIKNTRQSAWSMDILYWK